MLEMDGVCFSYASTQVLNEVTLNLRESELISIVGPNGVGKSTLLHCMNKILKPCSGTVLVEKRDLDEYSLKELAKHVGYVPYVPSDSFPLSVIDTVLMGRHPHAGWKFSRNDIEMAYRVLDSMGIGSLAHRPFNGLSAGQRQKVMLARGFVQQPKILLLDEPTSNLDIKHMLEVMKMLEKISKEKNIVVVMVNHDLNIASRFADRIILMSQGGIFAAGTPSEVITPENIREVYGVEAEVLEDCGKPHVILRNVVKSSEGDRGCKVSTLAPGHSVPN